LSVRHRASLGERFAIPQVSIQELVRLDGDRVRKDIELSRRPVYRMRGKLLPVTISVRNSDSLWTQERVRENEAINLVVLQADDHLFGLVVDEINDSEEIVVKPLGKQLKGSRFSPAPRSWVMGKSRSFWMSSGWRRAPVSFRESATADWRTILTNCSKKKSKECVSSLCWPGDSRMALPLAIVARLEEFPVSHVEKSGNEWVIQYRGKILSLIRLARVLEERRVRVRQALSLAEHDSQPLASACMQ